MNIFLKFSLRLGVCSKPSGKCPFPHVNRDKEKKVPPVKPKRKSLGQTPADHKKSRVATARYFDQEAVTIKEATPEETETTEESSLTSATSEVSSEMEAKRKRLMRKIELAKQGWTGISVSVVDDDQEEDTVIHHDHDKLDDSGPYEKIPDDEEEDAVPQRPPVGQLGDFISLAGYSSEDEDLHTDHRLI